MINLDKIRSIDLNEIMNLLRYQKDLKHCDSRRNVYLTDIGKISVMGSKFFNFSSGKGGGGAIDLVMYLRNYQFHDAVKFLSKNFCMDYGYSEKEISFQKDSKNYPYSEKKKFSMPERDDSKIVMVFNYLVHERMLPAAIVNSLTKRKALYANRYGSAVFCHCSFCEPFLTTGATIRGTRNGYKQTLGDKNEGLFWFGKNIAEADKIILFESPVDAISYFTLKRGSKNLINSCFIGLSGISFPSSLVNFIKDNNVVLATDNPAFEKNNPAKDANLRLEKELSKIANVIRETPQNKDWNEDLRLKTNRIVDFL